MRILLTGGSANGKSTYAEARLAELPAPRVYIATMIPYGDGADAKIARHIELRRGKGFESVERYRDVGGTELPRGASVLLECMCNLSANEMFDELGNERDVYDKILRDIDALSAKCGDLIVVTNDVGSDDGDYDASTLRYVDLLGRLNIALAATFDEVYELVCGIALRLK
ncbi:MAG: bifunctional adenosylcobinamide kinase/adenosylcobinamide-phosphate guanylyltransferase [Oscillospiraceae bacterium]|jgi:adenosylcobinamide kinase/adenosylcobinamide-phosphate guanylyltransferase|nr:bifunctional adenosylcobinamide kinase/adenosylcobinamide-phosphate guanylyltransferase [Oscillospiraceae bacterium]